MSVSRNSVVALFAGWVLVLVGGGGCAAAAVPEPQFDVAPAPGSSTASGGSWFALRSAPGERRSEALVVTNRSRGSLHLRLGAVRAETGAFGGVTYDAPRSGRAAASVPWLRLGRTAITLAPGASRTVGFGVALPRGVRSGDHIAGIAVEAVEPAGGSPVAAGRGGAGVVVRTRRVVAVQVTAPGPASPQLRVTGVTAEPRGDGMYLVAHVENVGERLLKANGRISVEGAQPFAASMPIDTFVPGTSIRYPLRWTAEPKQGHFPAAIELRFDRRVVRWSGTVEVGASQLRDLTDRSGAQTGSFALAPGWFVGAAVVVAAVTLLHRRRRRWVDVEDSDELLQDAPWY